MKNQEQNTPKSDQQPTTVENVRRTEKLCNNCGFKKNLNNFYFKKTSNCHSSFCKECIKGKQKEYNKANKSLISKNKAEYWKNKKQTILTRRKNHNVNLDLKKSSRRKWESNRLASDVQFKLSKNLRKRIFNAMKMVGKVKSAKTEFLLGCSIDFLISFIESKFQPGMSWENYGQWHVDHIIPISSVDLTNQQELLRIMNYKNLQPLWAADNIRKGNKIEPQKLG